MKATLCLNYDDHSLLSNSHARIKTTGRERWF
jgi:hypothetical protein